MSSDGSMILVFAEAKAAAKDAPDLDSRIQAAMKAAKNHWLTADENKQFGAAVAAIRDLSDDETKERIDEELRGLQALSALLSGVPVNMEAVSMATEPLGLMKIWKELKEK